MEGPAHPVLGSLPEGLVEQRPGLCRGIVEQGADGQELGQVHRVGHRFVFLHGG
jgi:hypothetical protein